MKIRFRKSVGIALTVYALSSEGFMTVGDVIEEFGSVSTDGIRWGIVDDRVMGGRSQGRFTLTKEATMLFEGDLSLENNGGFSSVRSSDVAYDFSDREGLVLRVRGDGRTYQMRLNTNARFRSWNVSFSAQFETEKGKWMDVFLPFDQFKAGFRGRSLPSVAFDASKVRRLGILLGDKKPGSFRLEIDSISTYGPEESVVARTAEVGN